VVNLTGCLVIGLVLGWAESRDTLSREARLLIVTGFLGSYTTFSAFGWETYDLFRTDELVRAISYAVLSVVLGVLAVWLGAQAGRAWAPAGM
jgi:fluoride exporter